MYASHVSTQIRVVCRKSPLPPVHFPVIVVELVFNRWKLTDPQSYRGWAAELVGIILSWMILPSPSNRIPESWARSFFLPFLGLGGKEDPNFAPSLFSRFKEIVGIYRDKSGWESMVFAVSSGAVSVESWNWCNRGPERRFQVLDSSRPGS